MENLKAFLKNIEPEFKDLDDESLELLAAGLIERNIATIGRFTKSTVNRLSNSSRRQ